MFVEGRGLFDSLESQVDVEQEGLQRVSAIMQIQNMGPAGEVDF